MKHNMTREDAIKKLESYKLGGLDYHDRVVITKPRFITKLFLGDDLKQHIGQHGKIIMRYAPDILSPSGDSVVHLDGNMDVSIPNNRLRLEISPNSNPEKENRAKVG